MELGVEVGVGRTSTVYGYGDGAVVKVPFANVPKHWTALEARFTTAARDLGLPVPEVLGVVDIDDRPSIIFERIEGRSLLEHVVDDQGSAKAFAREFADVHHRIQRAGIPSSVPDLVDRLCLKTSTASQLSDVERSEAYRIAQTLPRGAALLHGDLHPGNILMSPSGPVIIDWFDATIGHPVADVVRSSILLTPTASGDDLVHLPGVPTAVVETTRLVYLESFADLLDNAGQLLSSWRAVSAASRLSERAEVDESALLAIWHERPGDIDGRTEPLPGLGLAYEIL